MASPGLLGQLASCLLVWRGKVQSMRRRQVLIILAVFVVIVVVFQMEEKTSHDLRRDGVKPPFEQNASSAQKTAFDAFSGVVVSDGTATSAFVGKIAPNGREEQAAIGSQSESLGRGHAIASDKEEQEEDAEPQQRQTGSTSNADGTEQDNKFHKSDQVESDEAGDVDQDNAGETKGAGQNEEGDTASTGDQETAETPKRDRKETVKGGNTAESIETDKDNATVITGPQEVVIRNLHTDQLVKDIGSRRTKCFSVSGEPHEHTCAPSVVIAGYEKCGTSALYYKLTKHPEIVAHPKWKENCPPEDSLKTMWSWFEDMPVLESSASNGLLLNGCIGIVSKPTILRELQLLNPNLKVLVALRNYADWSYSYYGYRCYPGYDQGCEELERPNRHGPWKETRSPENFAKLVEDIKGAGKSPHKAFGVIRPNAGLFRPWLEELVDVVGRKAVKIIKQEDLSYSPREALAEVADFLDMDAEKFPDEAYTLVSNTNDHPSQISSVNETSTKAEISAVINSGAVVLNDTRLVLNKFWESECVWLRDNFAVHFSEVC